VIAELFVEPKSSEVATALLGTDRHEVAYRRIRRLTLRRLGSRPAEFLFVHARVGVVVGVRLRNGRRVVVKVFRRDRRPSRAKRYVQRVAARSALPCPRPIARARVWRSPAVIDEYVPGGERTLDADEFRSVSATLLARFVSTVGVLAGTRGRRLERHRLPPMDGSLWPTPQDFEGDLLGTAAGAEWIDEQARRALAIGPRSAGDMVIGHGDWVEHNLGVAGNRIVAVYDWDDVARDSEPVFVGFAAVLHGTSADGSVDPAGCVEKTRAYVAAYERGRGRRFDGAERRAVGASALYLVAYVARSEHALDPGPVHPPHSFRSLLARYGDAYLSI
jgi:hypothetical protein